MADCIDRETFYVVRKLVCDIVEKMGLSGSLIPVHGNDKNGGSKVASIHFNASTLSRSWFIRFNCVDGGVLVFPDSHYTKMDKHIGSCNIAPHVVSLQSPQFEFEFRSKLREFIDIIN
jgi:hypothetical protein